MAKRIAKFEKVSFEQFKKGIWMPSDRTPMKSSAVSMMH